MENNNSNFDLIFGIPFLSKDSLLNFHQPFPSCNWTPFNHFVFQLANVFLLIAFLAPRGNCGFLFLRINVIISSVFFCLWGSLVICAADTVFWNCVFVAVNIVQAVFLISRLLPFGFSRDIQLTYDVLFKPLKVSRHQFNKLLVCKQQMKSFPAGTTYAVENVTKIEVLALIISGSFKITKDHQDLQASKIHQFLDSTEWFIIPKDYCYVVSITALEDSELLLWNRDKLKFTLKKDPFLQSVFQAMLGKDVMAKLMNVDMFYRRFINNDGSMISTNLKTDENDSSALLQTKYVFENQLSSPAVIDSLHETDDRYNLIEDSDKKSAKRKEHETTIM